MPHSLTDPIRVLVVDDEEQVRNAYREILCAQGPSAERLAQQEMWMRLFPPTEAGGLKGAPRSQSARFEPMFCGGAEQAVDAVQAACSQAKPFALVFLDMRMPPGPDGEWAAKRIRVLDPDIEIVICTAFSDIDPAEFSTRVPPEDKLFYLQKPFHPHEVRQIGIALGQKWGAHRRITKLAYFDALTGLPNRTKFRETLVQALRFAKRVEENLAVLYIDLDNFKRINDTLGHAAGDELLCLVADRLRTVCRHDDLVGRNAQFGQPPIDISRLGGDEFVLLVRNIHEPADACRIADRVIQAIREPMQLSAHEILVTPSIGIALYPADGADAEMLNRNADLAMYFAKRSGPGQFALYEETMNAGGLQRLTVEARLRNALNRNELSLHYQPQVQLNTGHLAGLEALLRWNNADLGAVPPSEFIPIAEETGLILAIGTWVLRTACAQAKAWLEEGLPAGRMAVNVSNLQFTQPNFSSLVAAVLRETGLAPQLLELELTESLVMQEDGTTARVIGELKQIGVSIAIDDFGTGYSNFGRLRALPIDRLKIDRSFIAAINTHAEDRALVTAIIKMAQTIGLCVVAEGIEDFSQLLHLQEDKCDEAQGYLLSRPLPVADARLFLQRIGASAEMQGRTMRLRTIASLGNTK
jgi:diguanylate cyclase